MLSKHDDACAHSEEYVQVVIIIFSSKHSDAKDFMTFSWNKFQATDNIIEVDREI